MNSSAAAILLLSATALAQDVISLRPVATGLDLPVAIAHANDSRLFITLQRGQIVIYDGTQILPAPFLDIRSLVLCCGERGLLSVAFHPNYSQNGFFFVYYTDLTGDINIARYKVGADPNVADPNSALILKTISHRDFANHNGGQLAFGPDGYLYAGTGDGGSGGDPNNNGQNLQALLGKLLRLDVDNGSPYVPPLNPFVGRTDARPEIWSYGLRNPWRFSFDRATGDLFIGDVGQNLWEEVDVQSSTSAGGENYGWRIMEGFHCYNATTCDQTGLTLPVIEYGHTNGACSITGGYRYRGLRSSRLSGIYICGDYCNGIIRGRDSHAGRIVEPGTVDRRAFSDHGIRGRSRGRDVRDRLQRRPHPRDRRSASANHHDGRAELRPFHGRRVRHDFGDQSGQPIVCDVRRSRGNSHRQQQRFDHGHNARGAIVGICQFDRDNQRRNCHIHLPIRPRISDQCRRDRSHRNFGERVVDGRARREQL